MAILRALLVDLRYFLLPWLLFLVSCVVILISADKASIHLFINRHWSENADHVFQFMTWLGDGMGYIIFCILLFAWHRGTGVLAALSIFTASLLTQLLKQLAFEGQPRPVQWFQEQGLSHLLRQVPYVENALFNTFPSGHTTAGFAFFCTLSILARKHPVLQVCFFLLAAGIAYSRMYLSQHFLIDVVTGSVIGTGVAVLVLWVAERSGRYQPPLTMHT